jgi:hypothetical protein
VQKVIRLYLKDVSLPLFFSSTSAPTSHDLVCAPDSDVTFLSCDSVLFKVHRKNLDSHAEGFPPSEIASPPSGETVPLTESSAVLDLLFQYIYPQRPPDLTKVDFPILAQLSEAVEKYQIYLAMECCKAEMRYVAIYPQATQLEPDADGSEPFSPTMWSKY